MRSLKKQNKGGKTRAPRLLLASTSPRRQDLLQEAGYRFRRVTPAADERLARDLPARRQAEKLAAMKAESVLERARGEIVLGADTVVACGRRTVGKPDTPEEAAAILKSIRGKRHRVITGLCLIDSRSGTSLVGSAETRLYMKRVPDREIEAYVRSGEPIGKAGAYAVQERGDRFVSIIQGSFSNVVGLPLELLGRMLAKLQTVPMKKVRPR